MFGGEIVRHGGFGGGHDGVVVILESKMRGE